MGVAKAIVSQVSEVSSAVNSNTKQYLLVTCRDMTTDENLILSKNFKQIVVYHAELNSKATNLTTLSFDLLIVDISNRANHNFLEMVAPQAKTLGIKLLVLKKSMTNYQDLVDALEATVLSAIHDLEGGNFENFVNKTKLPKFVNRGVHMFKKCFGLLLKQ